MTLSVETIIVVALMMAVFAAVSTIGSSLYLGAGYERLRSGFDSIKKQTAFFSDAIHKLDTRVDAVEKQSGYFFQAISTLEQQQAASVPVAENNQWDDEVLPSGDEKLIMSTKSDAMHTRTDSLLTSSGFITASPGISVEPYANKAEPVLEDRPHFH